MSENANLTPEPDAIAPEFALRDEDGRLNPEWMGELQAALEADDAEGVIGLMSPLHESETGDVIESLPHDERVKLVQMMGETFDYSALTEVDDSVRIDLMEALPNSEIAKGMADLDSDDAVYILEDIEEDDRNEILAQMPVFERLSLKRSLDFPEESAGRRMQTEFIAIPPFWTVGQTIDYLRTNDDLPDDFYQIYVVDPAFSLLGTIPLDRILRVQRATRISDIMNAQVREIDANEDQEEAARVFERYDQVEVAVVDESKRLVGVLTIDDMVDVIHEEAGEDIHRMVGIGDEDISDSVWDAVKSRVTWLAVNLATAILASVVIGLFDATIEQMVALAVLMPIVASMGGNAGTQTMTVTVRAIAMRELDSYRVRRLILRELLVGVANGVIFAALIGVVTWLWFANPLLGTVIGVAMVINMIAAGTSGILIPLALDKMGADPAVASSAFVTTVTDVVGFFAFLGLAGLWFGLY
ncbi:magnesium transporter [Pelagibacterium xiamenense]|uniref:magnesium transporter n=1 Tax=Pelagibacterium xiamenense TaxID=2901140 RepID=UPI001E374E1A|nr:magnesium transporter [Pelagibacterium xiamenense]MCD7061188.1 magnesium transporter [Pelagibacterium xiamenense]